MANIEKFLPQEGQKLTFFEWRPPHQASPWFTVNVVSLGTWDCTMDTYVCDIELPKGHMLRDPELEVVYHRVVWVEEDNRWESAEW